MNKIKSIISSVRPYLTPKFLTFALLGLCVFFTLFIWLRTKEKESIKEHYFIVASDSRLFSLDLHGKEQYMQGFTSELMDFIAKNEEIKLQLVTSGGVFQFFDNLENGYYDGVVSSMPPSVLNQDKYLFSEPFYLTGPVLIVPIKSSATKVSDLRTIGIKTGTYGSLALANLPSISTLSFENINVALSELVAGRIDGIVLDSLSAYAYIQGYYKDKLKIVTPPLDSQGLRLVTKHNFFGKALVKIFNEGLEKAKEEKIYDKILQKWDLTNPETDFQK